MALENRKNFSEGREDRPSRTVGGGVLVADRSTVYGDQSVINLTGSKKVGLCDEGSYFYARNAVEGTAITGHAAPGATFDPLKTLLFLRNDNTAASGKRIYLDYIKLRPVAVGASGADFGLGITLDTGNTRYTSGGTEITEVNTNMASTNTAAVTIHVGTLVTAAETSLKRDVLNCLARSVIKVVGDSYTIDFGGALRSNAQAMAGTAVADIVVPAPPVVLGPSDQLFLNTYATSQSGADSFEFEMGFWER